MIGNEIKGGWRRSRRVEDENDDGGSCRNWWRRQGIIMGPLLLLRFINRGWFTYMTGITNRRRRSTSTASCPFGIWNWNSSSSDLTSCLSKWTDPNPISNNNNNNKSNLSWSLVLPIIFMSLNANMLQTKLQCTIKGLQYE